MGCLGGSLSVMMNVVGMHEGVWRDPEVQVSVKRDASGEPGDA